MKTLVFEQITDSRFDSNIDILLATRVNHLTELLKNMDGVHVAHFGVEKLTWDDGSEQCRCRFWVRKEGRKTTWDDIYKTVNSVKAVPYKFQDYTWDNVNPDC